MTQDRAEEKGDVPAARNGLGSAGLAVQEDFMKIESGGLLACGTSADGETIRLDLSDLAGRPVSLDLPFEQAQAIAMTLPTLLSKALKARTGRKDARYAFPLGHWIVETTRERP